MFGVRLGSGCVFCCCSMALSELLECHLTLPNKNDDADQSYHAVVLYVGLCVTSFIKNCASLFIVVGGLVSHMCICLWVWLRVTP